MTGEANELFEATQQLFYGLNEQIKSLNTEMKAEFKDVKERINKLETTQENMTDKNIRLLAEGFEAATSIIVATDKIQEDISSIKDIISSTKDIISSISKKFECQ